MTPEALTQGMAMLAEAFPHREVTRATMRLYGVMLADLDDDEFSHGVKVCIRKAKYFPSVAELVEAARPAPNAMELGQLFAKIELRACLNASLEQIARELGSDVRRCIVAVGGLNEFKRLDQGNNRPFLLRRFIEAMVETHRDHASAEIAPAPDDRYAKLVHSTSNVLAFPTPPKGRAS